jgi:small subunit ribosomal protein S1
VGEESEVDQELKGDVTETEPISMENLADEDLEVKEPRRGQLLEGVIMDVNDAGLTVDIGSKRDGFVPQSDIEKLDEEEQEFEVGDTVPVIVTRSRNTDGNVQLSVSQAKQQEDWLEAERMKEEQEIYETSVMDFNRGGLLVEFGSLRGFVPMSQLIGFSRIRQPAERQRRLSSMVGEPIMLKVIEVNRSRRRLILSQRAAGKEWRAERRQRLLEELEAGQVRTGRISQIADFGLFVNLGGLDGLVHISELSWGRIEDPSEIYQPGQEVRVKVLNVDRERRRIGLSIKALQPDPWESVDERYVIGEVVEGKISQIADFGIFVEVEPGVEGLLHNSELISMAQREELEIGTTELVKIIRIEPDRHRIGLSARQISREEWEQWYLEHPAQLESESKPEAEAEPEVEEAAAEAPQAEAEEAPSEAEEEAKAEEATEETAAEAEAPAEEEPADEAEVPAGEAEVPADEAEEPADEAEEPETEAEEPADEAEEPETEAEAIAETIAAEETEDALAAAKEAMGAEIEAPEETEDDETDETA